MHRMLTAVGLAFSLFIACSSSAPPVVDSVTFGAFSTDDSGDLSTTGTVAAQGAAYEITQLAVHFDPQTQNGITLYDGPPVDVTNLASPYQVTLAFQPSVPPGTYGLQITATDSSGTSSSPFDAGIVLQ
jgi:hypothetical protein